MTKLEKLQISIDDLTTKCVILNNYKGSPNYKNVPALEYGIRVLEKELTKLKKKQVK